jgi:cell wall-associated NlpC family hydrolase
MWAYRHVGVNLPHYTGGMMGMGRSVSRRGIRPGDLIFTDGGGHVGIYIGNGMMVHAPHTGAVVSRSPISAWSITAIRRVV